MPAFSVIHDVSALLLRQIAGAVTAMPGVELTVDPDDIVLGPPSETLDSGTAAVLFLYDVSVEPSLRNRPRLPDRDHPGRFIRPPLPLQLHYLFVPLHEEEETNHIILGRVLQHFHDRPVLRAAPGSALASHRGGVAAVPSAIRIRPDFAGFEALAHLWSALARPYRLSAGFTVDVAAVDSALPAEAEERVTEALGAVRRKAPSP